MTARRKHQILQIHSLGISYCLFQLQSLRKITRPCTSPETHSAHTTSSRSDFFQKVPDAAPKSMLSITNSKLITFCYSGSSQLSLFSVGHWGLQRDVPLQMVAVKLLLPTSQESVLFLHLQNLFTPAMYFSCSF